MSLQKLLRVLCGLAVVLSACVPKAVYAQSDLTGSIAGIVKDDTGAVLPGVTVEAASPALIEKVRSVISDSQGNYQIVDLRPGMYTVTFTLPGFGTYKRDGIELRTAFTATVNGEMKVGALEETVTVTGAAPTVDVHNVRSENLLSRKVIDTLPNSMSQQAFAAMVVGVTIRAGSNDVGGNRGELFTSLALHGQRANDMRSLYDGLHFAKGTSLSGSLRWIHPNQLNVQEVVVTTGGSMTGELGGVQMNYVPKEGGNTYHLSSLAQYSGPKLQQSNLNDELRARGLKSSSIAQYVFDTGLGFGGPLKKDRLWFYTGHRIWGAQQELGGTSLGYYNLTPGVFPPKYTPDLTRPTVRKTAQHDHNIRLTWQASPRHKINVTATHQQGCSCFTQVEGKSPEASRNNQYHPNSLEQVTWSHPRTNRLLFDAAFGFVGTEGHLFEHDELGVKKTDISVLESTTGLTYNSLGGLAYVFEDQKQWGQRFSMSYVTGAHAFRVGTNIEQAQVFNNDAYVMQNQSWVFRNNLPMQIIEWATPYTEKLRVSPSMGVFATDQWTLKRMTLNGAVRWDYVDARALASSRPASTFVGAAEFPEVKHVPQWNDFTTRGGVAYDLFGDGRTAIKGSFGKYLGAVGTSVATANSPVSLSVKTATRNWNDDFYGVGDPRYRNYRPDCDFSIPGATGECTAISNTLFGTVQTKSQWQPDMLRGWGKRDANYQASLSFQHEILKNLAVNVGYFRTWYTNLRVTDNTLVGPGDFDPYCITAPKDSRLPNGGGYQICGLYDITPGKFGLVDNIVAKAEDYGEQSEVYNGLDITMNLRFGQGGTFTGGVNTGQTVVNACGAVVDNPSKRFCKTTDPWSDQLQAKFQAAYPLPWYGLQAAGVFQLMPGAPVLSTYVASNAEIAQTLGRNLGQCRGAATCAGTVIVDLIEPFTMAEKRLRQLDLRLTKNFKTSRGGSLNVSFDVYNVFQNASVLTDTTRFGPAWLQPIEVLGPRMFKFGGQYSF